MEEQWTLAQLVDEVAARIAALPTPKNGQVRAVPDLRTVRYYGTIGLIDRPAAMRGRTALYGRRHLAQVVAIKRLQSMGRSLAEIQALWPTLDDSTLSRMSGVAVASKRMTWAAREEFWKRAPAPAPAPVAGVGASEKPVETPVQLLEMRIPLAPNVTLAMVVADEHFAISLADVDAIRAAAAPLVAELALRQLTLHPGGENV